MRLSLHNESTGRLEDLRPAAPPRCCVSWETQASESGLLSFRLDAFRSLLEKTLAYLGYEPCAGSGDIHCGATAPGERSGIWLKPAGVSFLGGRLPAVAEVLAKGFDREDLSFLCLKTHYRRPLEFSWEALESARGERAGLGEAARRLEMGRLAPNATGLAGYKKRFRDALADDLDGAEAVATLWDSLRPGALSPGSQLGALREADQVFGLLRLG